MSSLPNSFPGPRTSPTVKPLPRSNQRSLRNWQVTLGTFQVALLLGVITGCMACAFYLGFFSGQKVGVEAALNSNLSNAIRLPIASDDLDSAGSRGSSADDGAADVYAKLGSVTSDNSNVQAGHPNPEAVEASSPAQPPLAAIKPISAAPVGALVGSNPSAAAELNGAVVNAPDVAAIQHALQSGASSSAKSAAPGRPFSGGEPSELKAPDQGTTLGKLANQTKAKSEVITVIGSKVLNSNGTGTQSVNGAQSDRTSLNDSRVPNDIRTRSDNSGSNGANTRANEIAGQPQGQRKGEPAGKILVGENIGRGWFAQIAAQEKREEAEALGRRLKQNGFPVAVEVAKVRGQLYYRVLVGPSDTRQQAERLSVQVKREPGIRGEPFIRMIR